MTLTLWSCPRMSAKLTEAACARNHERATRAANAPPGMLRRDAAVSLSECIGCPGVRAFATGPVETVESDGGERRAREHRPGPPRSMRYLRGERDERREA